jgi:hypothetical protein
VFFRERRDAPVLITSAATARPEEIRGRERRYVISMLFRAVCLILAVVLFGGWLRFIAIVIALVTPWIAVIIANGGPRRAAPVGARTTVSGSGAVEVPVVALDPTRHVVIDGTAERAGDGATPAGPAGPAGPVP